MSSPSHGFHLRVAVKTWNNAESDGTQQAHTHYHSYDPAGSVTITMMVRVADRPDG